MSPKILAFLISLVNFFCLENETDVTFEEIILPLSETYFFNKLTFL